MSEAEDKAAVARIVAAAGSSFTLGMKVLPAPRRAAMFAVYAFCREADDAADESPSDEAALAALADWRAEIARLYEGAPETAVGRRLQVAIDAYGLRRADFEAVIDGCAMDAGPPVFAPDWATLDLYIDRVACAVGRLSVRCFGIPEPLGDQLAAAQGRALQLTNILRDFAEDAEIGRLYAPGEAMAAAGIENDALGGEPWAALSHPGFAAVAGAMGKRARDHFTETFALIGQAPKAARRPPRLMATVYAAQLRKLEARGWGRPTDPARLTKGEKMRAALRGLTGL